MIRNRSHAPYTNIHPNQLLGRSGINKRDVIGNLSRIFESYPGLNGG